MSKKEDKEVTTVESIAVFDERPDYLPKEGDNRGSENVGASDLIIPRIDQCQSLSPCRKKGDAAYIEDIEDGDLFNNVTREIYGKEVLIIPVFYKKEWIIWKDRDHGGGFRGAFTSEEVAIEAKDQLEDGDQCSVQDCAQHFALLVHQDTGDTEELVLSMSKSKMKVSRILNSLVRLNGGASFSRIYKVKSVSDKNSKNQDFYNISVAPAGWPSKAIFNKAEEMYNSIVSGGVKIDRNFDSAAEESVQQESDY
jgi:hypothetical protein